MPVDESGDSRYHGGEALRPQLAASASKVASTVAFLRSLAREIGDEFGDRCGGRAGPENERVVDGRGHAGRREPQRLAEAAGATWMPTEAPARLRHRRCPFGNAASMAWMTFDSWDFPQPGSARSMQAIRAWGVPGGTIAPNILPHPNEGSAVTLRPLRGMPCKNKTVRRESRLLQAPPLALCDTVRAIGLLFNLPTNALTRN